MILIHCKSKCKCKWFSFSEGGL